MKLKYKVLILILLIISMFVVVDSILIRNEEAPKYPYIVLNGRIFFDSNDNLRIDENDTLITAPLKLKIIPYVLPEGKVDGSYILNKNISYEAISKDGYYKFLVPPGVKELNIRLSEESIKYLQKTITNRSGKKKMFRTFELVHFGDPRGGQLWQSDGGGTFWSYGYMNQTADILVIGLE